MRTLGLAIVAVVLAGCAVPLVAPPAAQGLAFDPVGVVDAQTPGSEPLVAIDGDGRVFVSAMPGNDPPDDPYGVGFVSQAWVSDASLSDWTRLDPDPSPLPRGAGPGGGDTALAIAPDGSVYVADLWVGSDAMSSSHDHGRTWTRSAIGGEVPYYDRPWLATDRDGRAYLVARTLAPGAAEWVTRSDDGGVTWRTVGRVWTATDPRASPTNGNVVLDPARGALATIHGCVDSGLCVSRSVDQGLTWTAERIPGAPGRVDIIPVLAIDATGAEYATWSANGAIWWSTAPRPGAWTEPARVPAPEGTHILPWIAAAAAGRVAIAWYGTSVKGDANDAIAMKDATWDVYAARLDGAAIGRVANATSGPIHKGTVNTRGVGAPGPSAPDWRLGDYLSVAIDARDRAVVAFTIANGADPPHAAVVRERAAS